MALLTFTDFKPIRVADLGQQETYTVAASTAGVGSTRQGVVFMLQASTGKAEICNSTDIDIEVPKLVGFASTPQRSNLAEESVTILREADVFVGATALDGLDFGDPVYLSDTDGRAADAAGTNTVILGYVVPCFIGNLGTDRVLRISTSHLSIPPTVPAA